MEIDNVVPKPTWEFDGKVAQCFDDMLARSIPSYERMRELTSRIAMNHCKSGTVLDLGSSRGRSLEPFALSKQYSCFGLEVSEPMREESRKVLGNSATILDYDFVRKHITDQEAFANSAIILSILSIQFTPIEHRQSIIQDIYDCLRPGGIFMFVEKILGKNSATNQKLVSEYHSEKHAQGYSYDAINRKARSLEGALVPVTAEWNEDLLRNAGFRSFDTYYRDLNFCGWFAIK